MPADGAAGALLERRRLVLETGRESTAQRRAEAELQLRERDEELRRAIMATSFPIMSYAEDRHVVCVNSAWTDMSGYTREQIPHGHGVARQGVRGEERCHPRPCGVPVRYG
ncbi:hypothetical protein [Sorangium cellulosum]|uniref:hypothetical protein n=1 Tax=Sorangium cellulosum TaxID=56 RepID=UPI0005D223BF|nr:hypothetical protein [Sorangium cellulosum]